MITWYQVWVNFRVIGFCTDGKNILDHPERSWIGRKLEVYKISLIQQRAIVSKIADICQ